MGFEGMMKKAAGGPQQEKLAEGNSAGEKVLAERMPKEGQQATLTKIGSEATTSSNHVGDAGAVGRFMGKLAPGERLNVGDLSTSPVKSFVETSPGVIEVYTQSGSKYRFEYTPEDAE